MSVPDEVRREAERAGAIVRKKLLTAIQFVVFEPVGWVEGNEEVKTAADEVMKILGAQLKTLKTRQSDR